MSTSPNPVATFQPIKASAAEAIPQTAIAGAAVLEPEESPDEPEVSSSPDPAAIPTLTAPSDLPAELTQIVASVTESLEAGGHSTAATLLASARWSIEGGNVRIEVGAKPTMIRLTFNPAAEKLIRQGLAQAAAPTRFMIVPGEGLTATARPAASAPKGSIDNEARNHPMVLKAQELFSAEICSVIDLREKN